MRTRYAALAATIVLAAAIAATILLTSSSAPQPTSVAPQTAQPVPARTVTIPPVERQQCVNGAALAAHAGHRALADDCALLLAAKDTLAGTATLNWSATTAITDWTGVTVGTSNYDGRTRVTHLDLDGMSLNGSIPVELSELSALRKLRLGGNQLTGTIPAELGRLTELWQLDLGRNQLTGAIPPELGSIGPTLTSLHLSGPNPLPTGIGLTGSIPPQLGNLTSLQYMWLDGNRLTGTIPTRLGRLANLKGLHLNKNQLSGAIPTQLASLSRLAELRLEHNQLTGAFPTQLGAVRSLRKLYLKNNSGLTGCVPSDLRDVRYNDVADLNLPDCAFDAPETPKTPLPTFTLTITPAAGGSVDLVGAFTLDEAAEVTLTASWNDATHTLAGWAGACSGTATTCTVEMYADATISASFTPLPSDRCLTPTDADCIRAVYLGAPDDYAQVQEIPHSDLIHPGPDGRYQVARGQQITVVTAAPLPSGYTRFYLQRRPLQVTVSPTSFEQLIPPVGTTYTFTVTANEAGSNLITFNLTEARPRRRPRPEQKPKLGAVVVTTNFLVPTLRYNTLDISGAATTPGSYAFLKTAGDAASAIGNFSASALRSVELRVHPTDASGASRADFYDMVQVGDTFDYRTNGFDCGFRFKVTSIGTTTGPRTFGIEDAASYGAWCGSFVDDPGAAKSVEFIWRVRPGIPAADGVRVLLNGEPVGQGTYRIDKYWRWVIDVPAGMTIVYHGVAINELDVNRPNQPASTLVLEDVDTGSVLHIDPSNGHTGQIYIIGTHPRTLFEQLIASIRRQ